ncbi:MAG TPA: MG2 domain-containing protein [Dongiaceae bacterium]|nr:MG2 domain-containing protein [Dongiaceae bacterium]
MLRRLHQLSLRLSAILLVLILLPLTARADALQTIADQAAQYLSDIQSQYGAKDDPVLRAQMLAEAKKAMTKGDMSSAVSAYEQAIAAGENTAETWSGLADAQLREENFERATDAAYKAYEAASVPAAKGKALARLGLILEKAENPTTALEVYRQSLTLLPDPNLQQHVAALTESLRFRVIGKSVAAAGDRPEVCLDFYGNLPATTDVHYEDYVKVTPAILQPAFTVSDAKLCISGVEFGQHYRVSVLTGLPNAAGEKLAKAESVDFTVGDSEPSLGFKSATYVLPRDGSIGVPLYSVNVTKAKLRLLRINDRNLIPTLQRGLFLRAIDNYDADTIAQDTGEEVWKGTVAVQPQRNERVTTLIPVGEMVPAMKPGIYLLVAERTDGGEDKYGYKATQWLIVTDFGLTTMIGDDGLHVFLRSLDTGNAIEGVTVKLYARNNGELGSVVSDTTGQASFAPGLMRATEGRTPTAVMAFGKEGDFAFLDLTKPAFDLSDRGVGGRLAPTGADVFLYADRGVYRPGETVHLAALLRDTTGNAMNGLPLTIRVVRPDEVESHRYTLKNDSAGGYQVDIPISASARTGSWTVQAYLDPKGDPIGSLNVLVEDVVPAKIETKLTTKATSIQPGQPTEVALQSDYLYGAPGADLLVKGTLTIQQDSDPFDNAFPGYGFGLADEKVDPQTETFDDTTTDGKGQASFDMTPSDLPDTVQPLKATLRTEVYEFGGRPVIKTLALPIRNRAILIGIKPQFSDDSVASGVDAGFEVIAVDKAGAMAAASGLQYRLIPEDWDYQWFYKDSNWDYRVVTRDKAAVATGNLDLTAGSSGKLSLKVDWGYYRLEVFDPTSGAASSYRFYAGWGAAPGTGDTPDRLQIVADKKMYQAGQMATLLLKPPFTGQVLVAIATDHVIKTWTVDASPEGTAIEVPVDGAWGPGAYVLATAFRPGHDNDHGPGRAIGVSWIGIDPAARSLQVSFKLPDHVAPRAGFDVPITVAGVTKDRQAYVTLAAVDEGILQITDYATPAPQSYYFGKRQLGVDIRDLYGQLIDGRNGKRGQIREGGDSDALASRGAPPEIKLVALYSGIVKLDPEGNATVHLNIPDYNGRLRLMAIAWDSQKVGSGEAGLVVRDPIVVTLAMPRFLAPGDKSQITVSLQNLSGPAGDYQLAFSAMGGASLGSPGGSKTPIKQHLDAGGHAVLRLPLNGDEIGETNIHLLISGPDSVRFEHSAMIFVRAPQFPVLERTAKRLEPGKAMKLDSAALARFLPGTGELLASFWTLPNLDIPGLLRQLSLYPYGCLEQTTSGAMPLLYVSDVAKLWSTKVKVPTTWQLQAGIDHIFEMQRYDGAFALWSSTGEAEPWLSAYAMDFLTRAKAKGFEVSDVGYQNAMRWLSDFAQRRDESDSDTLSARAYALYVLAEAGDEALSPLRYLADNQIDKLPTALAQAQVGAALALHGDMARAADAFKKAQATLKREIGDSSWYGDYGGALRDSAAIITLVAETKAPGIDPLALLSRVAGLQASTDWLSTQEQGWLIMAANAVSPRSTAMSLAVNGKALPVTKQPYNTKPDAVDLQKGIAVTNAGKEPVFATVSLIGVPAQPLPAISNGFEIKRSFFTPDGKPADLGKLKQSDVLVVQISGKVKDADSHQTLVVDLLPAGFEIENARLSGSKKTDELSWLGDLTNATYTEYRDDRFVAAVTLGGDSSSFQFAYLVRAVTPGTYGLPASSVEDMYRPSIRARTAVGKVIIAPYQRQSE